MEALKKLIIVGVVLYIGYFVLSHHFIFFGNKVRILNKTDLTLNYIFFSVGTTPKEVQYKGLENILAIKPLRDAGIGDLIVEMELATEEEVKAAEEKIDSGAVTPVPL